MPPATPSTAEPRSTDHAGEPRGLWRLRRAGHASWALVGVLALLVAVGYLASLLSLVVVPLVLALFPATLLAPVAGWLRRRGVPAALAALAAILAALLLFGAVIGAMVPLVAAEAPALTESAAEGVAELEAWLEDEPFGLEVGGLNELLAAAQDQLGEVGELAPQLLDAATTAFETVAGLVLMFVVLFFYLKDGRRLHEGVVSVLPAGVRDRARGATERAWVTVGSYLRGLLLVASVDAVLIGAGLLALGVPLALPLAVLIFFGGLFPIVGAIVTGALAVLVAFADGGLWIGLGVLAIVVAVQQLESNVLQPVIQSRTVDLHPLIVVLSITAGGILLNIVGAFLAVPLAAIVAGTLRYLREDGDAGRDTVAAAPDNAAASD